MPRCPVDRAPLGSAVVTDPRPRPPYAGDELTTLTGFLDWHRATLRMKAGGLSPEQLHQSLPPSRMTLAGMVKHLAYVENWWFVVNFLGEDPGEPWASVDWKADEDWDWHSALDEDPEAVWALFEREVARSQEIVAAADGLGAIARRRHRGSGEPLSLRWIVVHMIEEYARHNGHADLIRESIDGSTGQ